MRTRPIDPAKMPQIGAVLLRCGATNVTTTPVLVDHANPDRSTICVVPYDDDDFELSHDELVNGWCEVLGADAKALRRQYWPVYQKLLVVDGDTRALRDHQRELGNAFDLFTATEAEGALAVLEREEIDAVLAEQSLSDQDGLSLLEQIRATHPQIRRLLTSVDDVPGIQAHVSSGLVERFFRKPLDDDEVLEHLSQPGLRDAGRDKPGRGYR